MFKTKKLTLILIILGILIGSLFNSHQIVEASSQLLPIYTNTSVVNSATYSRSSAPIDFKLGIYTHNGYTLYKNEQNTTTKIGNAISGNAISLFPVKDGLVTYSNIPAGGTAVNCPPYYQCPSTYFTFFKNDGQVIRYNIYGQDGANYKLSTYCFYGPSEVANIGNDLYIACSTWGAQSPRLYRLYGGTSESTGNFGYGDIEDISIPIYHNNYNNTLKEIRNTIAWDSNGVIYIFGVTGISKLEITGQITNLFNFPTRNDTLNLQVLSIDKATNTFYLKNNTGYYSLKDGIYTPINLAVNPSKLDFTTRNGTLQSFIGDSNSNTFQFSYSGSSWDPTTYSSVLPDKTNLNYSTIVDGDYINLFYADLATNEIRYQYSNSSNQWSNPVATGMYTNTSFVSANHLGTYNLFYIGLDGKVHSRYYNGSKWINDKIANITSGAKQLQVLVDGEYINLFYLDANNEVNYVFTRDGNWSYPTKLTGLTTTKKFFIVNHLGSYKAFYVDLDNSLKRIWYNDKNWVDKQVIAGETDVKEVSGFVEKDYINLAFIRNSDSVPRYRYTNNGQWSGPTEIR
jgi:hypothetical protein